MRRGLLALVLGPILVGAGGCKESPGSMTMTMRLTSDAFIDGAPIPARHTGDGEDVSPPLAWSDVPDDTAQFALVCEDPDAPSSSPWVHWVIYGIPAATRTLPEGVPAEPTLSSPPGARQGRNSWSSGRTIGYRGPAPPPGHGVHHYHFRLYALDEVLDLAPGADAAALAAAVKGHVLAEGLLVGTYER